MADNPKEIASALQQGTGDAGYYQKSNMQYQEKVRGTGDAGLGKVAQTLIRQNEIRNAEIEQENKKRAATAKTRAKVKGMTNQELTELEIENPETLQAYNAGKFYNSVSDGVREFTNVLKDENFLSLPVIERKQQLQDFHDTLMDEISKQGLVDDENIHRFVAKQVDAVNLAYSSAVYEHQNVTIPTRTISTHVDGLIKAQATPEQWKSYISTWKNPKISGKMPTADLDKVIYGEVNRAIDSGNLDAYSALKDSDVYGRLTTDQKSTVEKNYVAEIKHQEDTMVAGITSQFKDLADDALASGNLMHVESALVEISKLPKSMQKKVRDKINTKLNKLVPAVTTLQTFDAMEPGQTRFDEDAAQLIFKREQQKLISQAVEDPTTGEVSAISPVDASIMAAMTLADKQVFTKKTQEFFDIKEVVFDKTTGAMDHRTAKAFEGFDKLIARGYSEDVIERIAGEENYDLYLDTKLSYGDKVPRDIALERILEKKKTYDELDTKVKNLSKLKGLTEITTSSWFDRAVDDLVDTVTFWLPNFGTSDDVETTQIAPITAGVDMDNIPDDVSDVLAAQNSRVIATDFSDFMKKHPTIAPEKLQDEYLKSVKERGVTINGNMVLNRKFKELASRVSPDVSTQSQMASLSMQVLTPLVAMEPAAQSAVIDSVTTVEMLNDTGEWEAVTDRVQRSKVLQSDYESMPNVSVRVDLDKYQTLYKKGGKLSSGQNIPAIRDIISEQAGWYDTRKFDFTLHRVEYSDRLSSFVVDALDRDGDVLTTDAPILEKTTKGTKLKKAADYPIRGVIPDNTVYLFMKAFADKQ